MTERFTKPTDKQLMELAIVWNDGKIEYEKLSCMIGMAQMIIDRLYDNGHMMAKSKNEIEIEANQPKP